MSIKIDYKRDSLLDEFALATLRDRYMIPGEESPQEAFARAAEAFADDEAHAQRLYDYVCLLYTSPSPRDRQKSRMPSSA